MATLPSSTALRAGRQARRQVAEVADQRLEVARIAGAEVDAHELAQQRAVDDELGRLQAAGRRDDGDAGRPAAGEMPGVGELAAEVEAADEAERIAQRQRAGGEALRRQRGAAVLQQHRAAASAAERGRQEEGRERGLSAPRRTSVAASGRAAAEPFWSTRLAVPVGGEMTGTAKVGAVVAVASASSVAAVFVPAAPWTAGLFEWLAHAGPLGW